MEADGAPGIHLVGSRLFVDVVDVHDVLDDCEPFGDWDEWQPALGGQAHLIGNNAGDEDIAPFASVLEDVQMTDVEEVVRPRRIAYNFRHSTSPWRISLRHEHPALRCGLSSHSTAARQTRLCDGRGSLQYSKWEPRCDSARRAVDPSGPMDDGGDRDAGGDADRCWRSHFSRRLSTRRRRNIFLATPEVHNPEQAYAATRFAQDRATPTGT